MANLQKFPILHLVMQFYTLWCCFNNYIDKCLLKQSCLPRWQWGASPTPTTTRSPWVKRVATAGLGFDPSLAGGIGRLGITAAKSNLSSLLKSTPNLVVPNQPYIGFRFRPLEKVFILKIYVYTFWFFVFVYVNFFYINFTMDLFCEKACNFIGNETVDWYVDTT